MKLSRRLERAEEVAAARVPERDLVTADDLKLLKELGCDTHGAEAELGHLDWDYYITWFTEAELEVMAAADQDSGEAKP